MLVSPGGPQAQNRRRKNAIDSHLPVEIGNKTFLQRIPVLAVMRVVYRSQPFKEFVSRLLYLYSHYRSRNRSQPSKASDWLDCLDLLHRRVPQTASLLLKMN